MDNFVVGIIGMGDMGRLYARKLSSAGWKVHACDRQESYETLRGQMSGVENLKILRDGDEVSKSSDYILYNVEARNIGNVIQQYALSTKPGAIVGGQTSCKAPEIFALEQHFSRDTDIICIHSLHGPLTDPMGQPLVIIPHRASHQSLKRVEKVLSCLKSNVTILSARDHDQMTANTQSLMSIIFLSLATAVQAGAASPSLSPQGSITGTIQNLASRMANQKWHVYAGISLLNPYAEAHVTQFMTSASEIQISIQEYRYEDLLRRLRHCGQKIFAAAPDLSVSKASFVPQSKLSYNEEAMLLSLLATIDTWSNLNISPASHYPCSTPQYRVWVSMVEYLLFTPGELEASLYMLFEKGMSSCKVVESCQVWQKCIKDVDFKMFEQAYDALGCSNTFNVTQGVDIEKTKYSISTVPLRRSSLK